MELGTGRTEVMAAGKFVAYYRVSTDRQGRSGLGLDAQRKAVEDYLNGGGWELVGEFVEVESGRKSDRPELLKALAACRRQGATLVIAKLDRLSRNVAFVSNLRALPHFAWIRRRALAFGGWQAEPHRTEHEQVLSYAGLQRRADHA
jgi:hypothetical protein